MQRSIHAHTRDTCAKRALAESKDKAGAATQCFATQHSRSAITCAQRRPGVPPNPPKKSYIKVVSKLVPFFLTNPSTPIFVFYFIIIIFKHSAIFTFFILRENCVSISWNILIRNIKIKLLAQYYFINTYLTH